MKKYNILYSEHLIRLKNSGHTTYQKLKDGSGEFISYVGIEYLKHHHSTLYNNFIILLSMIEDDMELEGRNKGNWQDRNMCKINCSSFKDQQNIDFFEKHQIKHYHLGNLDGTYNQNTNSEKARIEDFNKNGKTGSCIVHYLILEKEGTKSVAILGISVQHIKNNFPKALDEDGNTLYWHIIFGE